MSVTAQEALYTTELVNAFYSNDKKQLVNLNSMYILCNPRHSFKAVCCNDCFQEERKKERKKKYYVYFSMKNYVSILLSR